MVLTEKNKKERVVFTFDSESLADLRRIQRNGGYADLAATVADALQILAALQGTAMRGSDEIFVRDSKTGMENQFLIKSVTDLAKGR